MEVMGICAVCGEPGKIYTCSLCGRHVCEKCFDLKNNTCKPCSRGPSCNADV